MLLEKWLLTTSVKEKSTIANSGFPYLYGSGIYGQIGDNTASDEIDPTTFGIRSWAQLSTGTGHTLGLRSDSYLFTWGENDTGQLGDQTTVHRSSPVQLGGRFWKSISTKNNTSYGIRNDGLLYAWGQSANGELGINDFVTTSLAKSWSIVSMGDSHTVALRSDGMLFTWGNNVNGQLGLSDTAHRSSQVQIGTSSWVYVAAGSGYSAAIRSDGALFTWGANNTNSVLGDGTRLSRSSPVQIGASSWSVVTCGILQTVGLTIDGSLYAWGVGTGGATADGALLNRSSPVQVTSLYGKTSIEEYAATRGVNPYPYSWLAVNSSSGSSSMVALQSDSTLWAWGANDDGQLGDSSTSNKSSPVLVDSSSWAQVVTAGSTVAAFSAGVKQDGSLWVWGDNAYGQLGLNDLIHRSSPVQLGTNSWSFIGAGDVNLFGITTDGSLFGWGYGPQGQLGDNTAVSRSSPVQIGSESWSTISVGRSNITAIRNDGLLFSWGRNTYGNIGDGTIASRSSPVQVTSIVSDADQLSYNSSLESPMTLLSWSQVSAGYSHTAAIRSDGLLFVWGSNSTGQLGDNTIQNKSSPTLLGSRSWIAVSAGGNSTAAIRSDNKLFVWGLNNAGNLGLSDNTSRSSPVQVGASSWVMVSTNVSSTVAISADGGLFSMGLNAQGQLGDGTIANKSSPVQIGTDSWTSVNAGVSHTAAIRTDGALFVWGSSTSGILGLNDVIGRSSPVQLGTSSWTAVSCGITHTSAIRSDGALFMWGLNSSGQLGDNTVIAKSSPIQIGTSSWTAIAAIGSITTAIRSDGALYTWGANNNGQIGDGTVTNKSSPVQIGTSSWSFISNAPDFNGAIKNDGSLYMWGYGLAGQLGSLQLATRLSPTIVKTVNDSWSLVEASDHTMGIRSDGKLFAWGLNTSGQLGNNDGVHRSAPIQIGNSNWVNVAVGAQHTVALEEDYSLFAWGLNSSGQVGDGTIVNKSSPVQLGTSLPNGYYSNFFANLNWASVPNSSNFNFGSNDFTIEAYVYLDVIASEQVIVSLYGYTNNRRSWYLGVSNGKLRFRSDQDGTSASQVNGNTLMAAKTWYHVAAVKSGNVVNVYLDGVLDATGFAVTTLFNNTVDPVYIGAVGPSLTGYVRGNISNLRILNGTALYTSDFTKPSSPLTDITNTVLLTCQSSSFVDNSTYNNTITVNNAAISGSSPFSTEIVGAAWSTITAGDNFTGAIDNTSKLFMWGNNTLGQLGIVRTHNVSSPVVVKGINDSWSELASGGSHAAAIRSDKQLYTWGFNGSGQLGDSSIINKSVPTLVGASAPPDGYYSVTFNGTSNYLEITNNSAFNFGTGDFTGECWFNLTNNAILDGAGFRIAHLFGPGQSVTNEAWFLALNGNGTTTGTGLIFQVRDTSGTATNLSYSYSFSKNTWYHVAVSKVGTTLTLFINGNNVIENNSWTVASNSGTSPFRIGRRGVSSNYEQYFPGQISNLRVVKGTGLYSSSFAPTGPLSAVTNTVLLTCQSTTIKDNSINNFTITNI